MSQGAKTIRGWESFRIRFLQLLRAELLLWFHLPVTPR